MRTFGKGIATIGMVALMAAPAWAQQGRGFGRFGGGLGGGAALLSNKGVQEELKATDEQAEKLNAFARETMERQRGEFQKLRDLSDDERREKMQELIQTRDAELQKGLSSILKPEQVKRFRQIELQQAGSNALMMPRVQDALKLTDEQKSKLREVNEELGESMRDAFQGFQSDRQGTMKKLADLRKQATEKAANVLTAEQKSSWKEMTGEPFEVRLEPRRPN